MPWIMCAWDHVCVALLLRVRGPSSRVGVWCVCVCVCSCVGVIVCGCAWCVGDLILLQQVHTLAHACTHVVVHAQHIKRYTHTHTRTLSLHSHCAMHMLATHVCSRPDMRGRPASYGLGVSARGT